MWSELWFWILANPRPHDVIRRTRGEVVGVCVSCVDAHPKQLLRQQPPAPTASSSSIEHVRAPHRFECCPHPEFS
eukprot:362287-Amphidinium_carterae.1